MTEPESNASQFDVVIIGGGLAGSATAIQLLKKHPDLHILIVEKSESFGRRVGEATVEVSTYFLQRCLGLAKHLHHEHLVKNGLRFWFNNESTKIAQECGEIGGKLLSRLPSYLVDRKLLDQHALDRAVQLGATLKRPAIIKDVSLNPGGEQIITLSDGKQSNEIRARWVIDASGVAAMLARKNGWFQKKESHPMASVWARWKNVESMDAQAATRDYSCFAMRDTATNHFTGYGWWAWWIPLRGGDVSIGLVFDQRLVSFPEEGSLAERLKQFLSQHPAAREVMRDAVAFESDTHWRRDLSYSSSVIAGNGFALVGDAGGFLDPFYSPGLDWLSFTTHSAAELVSSWKNDENVSEAAECMNRRFTLSYDRWFRALYLDKYHYLGEFDLMKLAFVLDIGLYYLGVVSQAYLRGEKSFSHPCFSQRAAGLVFWLMKTYNRRFAAIAIHRHQTGRLGRHNHKHFLVEGFNFNAATVFHVAKAFIGWGILEMKEGWRTWLSQPNGR